MTKLLQFGESQMKRTCFLSLVNYIIRDIVTALLLMNVFHSCSLIKHKKIVKNFSSQILNANNSVQYLNVRF